ncbi:MAG: T9SS type A sorting domain-containing protein [Bacteroidota bacterium]
MKRLTLLLLLLSAVSVFTAKAQLAPVGTKWTYLYSEKWGSPYPPFYYETFKPTIVSDTLIDSTIYSKIGNYFWTIENDKVFYYFKSKKRLLFDFNAKQKDTLLIDLMGYSRDTVLPKYRIFVDSIFYTKGFMSNDSVKSFSYINIDTIPFWFRGTICKKIIFMNDLISRPSLMTHLYFESGMNFICYEEANGYSLKKVSGHCYGVGVEELKILENQISIFPNPSSGIFQIELKNNIHPTQLFIYDAKGDLAEQKSLNTNSNQFESSQKNGLYYFVFELESGDRILKKVMLQK